MKNAEMTVHGMGARASRVLLLEERTRTVRQRASEALRAANLNGRCWWAAKSIERWPERACRLMVAEGAWDDVVAALDAADVAWEEVS